MKTLIFEGAGWEKADSSILSGVGNCRIRTRIRNNNGRVIYLEMGGSIFDKKSKSTPEYAEGYDFAGRVDHCFYDDAKWDARRNFSVGLKDIEREHFEYNKDNILKFVNEKLNCSFDKIEVINDNNVRVHDTEQPLCDCNTGEYEPYKDIEINIDTLDDVKPLLDYKDRGMAQYKVSYDFVKQYPFLQKWMQERTRENFPSFRYYVTLRFDKNGIITDAELSARENFCTMGLSSEDLEKIINEIKKEA